MEIRNQLAVCPYDHNHLVKKGRMQQHLVKCRQNHLHEEFKVCPFNACHRLHPAEFPIHISSCPDKECLEKEIYNRAKEQSGKFKTGNLNVPLFNNEPPPCNEDWDQDDDFQEDNHGETNGNMIPPLQPRVLHTAVVSAMKKQNHDSKGLRQPKNLPKVLGQHWPKHENQSECENSAQELSHGPRTETTEGQEVENNTPNVPNEINNCIDPSTHIAHRTSSSELACDMPSSNMHDCALSSKTSDCSLSSMTSDSSISPKTPNCMSPKTSGPTLSSKISNCTPTSPAENSSSQETEPKNSLTIQCKAADKIKPFQIPTGDLSLTPISPLTEKMRSLGRGMLFKFQVKISHPPGSGGSVVPDGTQTRNRKQVTDTDTTGCEKQLNCQTLLVERSTDSLPSSDTNQPKETGSSQLQPVPTQNSSCDDKPEAPSLGRGRGILALKFFRHLNKNQEPCVGNRSTGSAIGS